jgi:hypothetical protein
MCKCELQPSRKRLLNTARILSVKPEGAITGEKQFARKAKEAASNAVHDAVRILRIIILLHSAKDFSSVLQLYGMDDSSGIE